MQDIAFPLNAIEIRTDTFVSRIYYKVKRIKKRKTKPFIIIHNVSSSQSLLIVNTFNLGISFCNSISSGQNYSDIFFIYMHCYRQSEAYYSRFILLHSSDILENVEHFKSNLSPSEEVGSDFIASLDQRDLLRSVGRKEESRQREVGCVTCGSVCSRT
jgi:hypothetical protein